MRSSLLEPVHLPISLCYEQITIHVGPCEKCTCNELQTFSQSTTIVPLQKQCLWIHLRFNYQLFTPIGIISLFIYTQRRYLSSKSENYYNFVNFECFITILPTLMAKYLVRTCITITNYHVLRPIPKPVNWSHLLQQLYCPHIKYRNEIYSHDVLCFDLYSALTLIYERYTYNLFMLRTLSQAPYL